jgi:hypothetical protein
MGEPFAVYAAKWVADDAPAQLLYHHRRPPPGIRTWLDRVAEDEIQLVSDLPATTPARTALDLACRYPLGKAVAALDALARVSKLDISEAELLAERYSGRRNIRATAASHPSWLPATADANSGL